MKGLDSPSGDCNQECPICFLNYREINKTKCCGANICTECYLQVRPQKDKQACCPFCNAAKVGVTVAKKLSSEQVEQQRREEQRAVEARRKRSQSLASDGGGGTNGDGSCFGSSLVAMERARSESLDASAAIAAGDGDGVDPSSVTAVLPMSPQERQRLEAEMRAQSTHPLTARVEAEAAERRMENDRSYARTHRQDRWNRFRRRRGRGSGGSGGSGSGGRDWNQIVDAFERGGNGQIHSLDDLVVLEAAILLSMGEEARSGGGSGEPGSQPAFDPARHARDGFPLVRSYFANRNNNGGGDGGTAGPPSSGSDRRPSAALDTAALLMRGISEEDQVAMAIEASLRDQGNGAEGPQDDDDDEYDDDDDEYGDEYEEDGDFDDDDGRSRSSSGSSFGSRGDDDGLSEVEEDDYYDDDDDDDEGYPDDDDLPTDGEDSASSGGPRYGEDSDIEVDGGGREEEEYAVLPESGG